MKAWLSVALWYWQYLHLLLPNGLAFSCRERAGKGLQNANDLAREAVSCNAGLDGNAWYGLVIATIAHVLA